MQFPVLRHKYQPYGFLRFLDKLVSWAEWLQSIADLVGDYETVQQTSWPFFDLNSRDARFESRQGQWQILMSIFMICLESNELPG
jgi:hypothetical protein